jgi:hypothetical protein
MDNIGQIKAILLECKLITIKDFDKINISFDSENIHIKGVDLKNGDLVEAEKRLERKLVLHSS